DFRIDENATRKMFLYYFYRSGKEFLPEQYFRRLRRIVAEGGVEDDVSSLLRPGIDFDLPSVVTQVLERIVFLLELDGDDGDFLHLARTLLGKRAVPKAGQRQVALIHYPIKSLMGDVTITPEAAAIRVDDIRLHRGRAEG